MSSDVQDIGPCLKLSREGLFISLVKYSKLTRSLCPSVRSVVKPIEDIAFQSDVKFPVANSHQLTRLVLQER
jgi:hypothetical protein